MADRGATLDGPRKRVSVLECAGPPALSNAQNANYFTIPFARTTRA